MKRSWSLVVFVALSQVACKRPAPAPPAWSPALTEGENVSACAADGTACVAAKPGDAVLGKVLKTAADGRALLALNEETTLELGSAATIVLTDGNPRVAEIRGGIVQAVRVPREPVNGAVTPARVALKLADELVDLDARAPTSLAMNVRAEGRATVTVNRGVATFRIGNDAGTELHAGESAAIVAGAALDRRAGYAGEIARVDTLRAVDPKSNAVPRGLGTMTARVPGTDEIVAGVRLASHKVHASIRNGFARTEIEEVFANDSDRSLEGRYVFAVPPGASVGRLALWVSDRLVEDEVVPRAKAAAVFKGIVDDTVRPRDPALLEWVSSGEVSLKVFPLPPKGSRTVVLAYDEALSTRAGEARYVLPLSLGDARANTMGNLAITVDVAGADAPTEVLTPGYAAKIATTKDAANVVYEAKDASPHDDFVVSWRESARAPAEVAAYVPSWASIAGLGIERIAKAAGDGSWAAVRVTAGLPEKAEAPAFAKKDRVIVLDKSFSQSRESLESEVRVALGVARALDPDERFAILACDSACDGYPEKGLAPSVESSFEGAEKWAKGLTSSGSSDVAGAVLSGLARVEPNGAGQVVFLGDGAATSGELTAQRIAARIRPQLAAKNTDLRMIGAGNTVDAAALGSLAGSLSATYEPLASGGSLTARIDELASALRSPVIHAAELQLPPTMTDVYPHTLPALRLGQQITVMAKLTQPEGDKIELIGVLDGKPYSFESKLTWGANEQRQTPLLPRLWAARRIDDLRSIGDAPSQKEMIDLSQKFHVLTPLTSMLVLENAAMFAQMGIARTTPRPDGSTGAQGADPVNGPNANQLSAVLNTLGSSPSGALSSSLDSVGKAASGVAAGGGGLGMIGGGLTGGVGTGAPQMVAGPRALVTGGGSSVGGTIPGVERVIAGARARVRACYQAALNANPDEAGRIAFRLTITQSGEVSAVTTQPSGSLSGAVISCVQRVLRAVDFSPPDGGASAVTGSFTLANSNDGRSSSPNPPMSAPHYPGRSMPQAPTTTAAIRASDDGWRVGGDDALTKLRDAVQKSPTSRKAIEALVRGLLVNGRYDQSLVEAQRFAEADPDSAVARDLLAYAAVLSGDAKSALGAVDAAVESDARSVKAHLRAANAFESNGDERRACAHWRSLTELSKSEDYLAESLRCRARVEDDRDAALALAKSVEKPGAKLAKVLASLEANQVAAFAVDSALPGQLEVKVLCADGVKECPIPALIAPNGAVFSPPTPADARTTPHSVAVSALRDGTYRVVLIGGSDDAHGEVTILAAGTTQKLTFARGGTQTVAAIQITLPSICCWGLGIGLSSLSAMGGVW